MPIDRTHQHISSDIVRLDDVHQPIDPSGGGGVTVTGSQGGGPFSASAMTLAGQAIDLGGGAVGQGYALVVAGPYTIAWDTPDAQQGDDDPVGAAIGDPLPVGTIILAINIDAVVEFDGLGNRIEIYAYRAADAAHNDLLWNGGNGNQDPTNYEVVWEGHGLGMDLVKQEAQLRAFITGAADLATVGEGQVRILLATPAS